MLTSVLSTSELSYTAPFEATILDEIRPGRVDLGVPLLDGVVQIGVKPTDYERGLLTVEQQRWHGSVKVTNNDGSPLQVALAGAEPIELFAQPVESVTFLRTWDNRTGVSWTASGKGLYVPEAAHIRSFAKMIGLYTVQKQADKPR